jgi:hypothetical protein
MSFQPNINAKEFRPTWAMAPPQQQAPSSTLTNQYQEYHPVAVQQGNFGVVGNAENPQNNYMLTDEEFAEYDKWVEERRAAGLPVDDDDYYDDEEDDSPGDDLDDAERAWMEDQVAQNEEGAEGGVVWRPPVQDEVVEETKAE